MIPAGAGPLWFTVVSLTIIVPTIGWMVYESVADPSQWLLGLAGVPLVGVQIFLFYLVHASRTVRLTVSDSGLRVSGFMGRELPLESLDPTKARGLDLTVNREYRVKGTVTGTNMPGYKCGRCRLKNKERAVVCLTEQRRVLYMPTKDSYAILVSVDAPREVIKAVTEAMSHDRQETAGYSR